MRRFRCFGCGSALYFGNRSCLKCGREAAYLPAGRLMLTVDPAPNGQVEALHPEFGGTTWRECANRLNDDACFWLVDPRDSVRSKRVQNPDGRSVNGALCRSCRLSTRVPFLGDDIERTRWKRVEAAKQWLVHGLLDLDLPFDPPLAGTPTLEFHLLAERPGEPIITGHLNGVITIDVAEGDDVERARRREVVGEQYRTLLGHFRHEVGHYYWMVLASQAGFVDSFRELFGDERANYDEALQRHYRDGPRADWQNEWISEYAASHPWEDWAECWAHFLHITDAIQTAREHGLRPDGATLLDQWQPISLLINDLNRAVGMRDAYPFVVVEPVRRKIEFIATQAAALANGEAAG